MSPQTASNTPPTDPAHGVHLDQLFAVFWRGRWIILVSTLISIALGYYYAQQRGTVWRATARVYVEKNSPSSLAGESLVLGTGARNYANTQAEVIISSEVLNDALKLFQTDFPTATIADPGRVTLSWLKRNVLVKVGRDNEIITVTLESRQRDESCAIVNDIVESYKRFQNKKRKSTGLELHQVLEKEQARCEAEYDSAVETASAFRKDNSGVGSEIAGLTVLAEKWRGMSKELEDSEQELRIAESLLKSAKGADPALLRQLLISSQSMGSGERHGQSGFQNGFSTISMLGQYPADAAVTATQIETLQRERLTLLLGYTQPEHPEIHRLDAMIVKLKERLAEQEGLVSKAFAESLQPRAAAALARRDELKASVADLQKRVYELDQKDQEYRKLQALADRAKEALDSVFVRLRQINFTNDADPTFVHTLDFAKPETAEMVLGNSVRFAGAVFSGLLIGMALSWLLGLLDQRIRNVEDVRQGLRLPVLAILPRVKAGADPSLTAIEAWDDDPRTAEAARSLRTAVYLGMAQGEGNLVLVTSPDANDGKTKIAGALAIAMAKAGQKTLLIDADLRKPRQAVRFGLNNDIGLSTALASDIPVEQAILRTSIPELHVIPSGPVPSNPAEILNSHKFEQLLAHLGKSYDRVIIDSPPVLPVTDARILATKCNIVVLGLRVDRSTRKRGATARDALLGVGAKILGVALNDMPSGIGYGYGYGYGYGRYGKGYGYGSGYGEYAEKGKNGAAGHGERREPREAVRVASKETK